MTNSFCHTRTAEHLMDQPTKEQPNEQREKGEPKTFWIRPSNSRGLDELSKRTGASVSFLINRAVALLLENPKALF